MNKVVCAPVLHVLPCVWAAKPNVVWKFLEEATP